MAGNLTNEDLQLLWSLYQLSRNPLKKSWMMVPDLIPKLAKGTPIDSQSCAQWRGTSLLYLSGPYLRRHSEPSCTAIYSIEYSENYWDISVIYFTSDVFTKVAEELDITHVTSNAYHPESQGALERFHQTLKFMLGRFCPENEKDSNETVPFVLFAVREYKQEFLGFSPFELMFRRKGPLAVLKASWHNSPTRRQRVCTLAHEILQTHQKVYKSLIKI